MDNSRHQKNGSRDESLAGVWGQRPQGLAFALDFGNYIERGDFANPHETKLKYESAVADLVKKIKMDKNIVAVIVCGSLSYDRVWEKSELI